MNTAVAIFIGGGLGSLARFGVSKLVLLKFSTAFPLGTLMANLLSCVVLGSVVAIFSDKIGSSDILKPLIIMGFCGGFSTFSTFSIETWELMRMGNYVYGILNILVSVLLCVFIIAVLMRHS